MRTVPLYGKNAAGRVALVDGEDYELVSQYRWHVQEDTRPGHRSGPYARTDVRQAGSGFKPLFMHNLIAGYCKPDHVDGNGLNNQRSNLRPATAGQNMMNRRKRPGVTSRYLGVHWYKTRNKWVAVIHRDRKRRHLGYFSSEIEAALAYDAAARELFGEYARPNFPDHQEAS